jgi:hypothetical protein
MYKKIVRFDLVFSYWIFLSYLLYEFKITSLTPKLALVIGLIENIVLLLFMIYYSNHFIIIFLFCFVNFFIKIIPLLRLRKETIHQKDIYPFIGLFVIYNIWLRINNTSMNKIMKDTLYGIQNNLPIGPISYYLKNMIGL